ncbi:MAG TPA: FAD-dependent oxidoreductase [Candidatus Paceibacterota bacterium]|nr:FAD-dependent oxidoreductase [Verrucomicrobiota bacterium]HRZ47043.1 FAD-dependent oxidoreductase [Candidatus Paceibacterota bacterium]
MKRSQYRCRPLAPPRTSPQHTASGPRRSHPLLPWMLGAAMLMAPRSVLAREVAEPAQALPTMAEVDVVVAGGGAGGVAAAVAAARGGARVFLVEPRHYLGEDLCSTYRLWSEPSDPAASALAKRLLQSDDRRLPPASRLPFAYAAQAPSAAAHPDTRPPSLLRDGRWGSASAQSVQYDTNVVIDIDLGKTEDIRKLHVMAYQRPGDFAVGLIQVSALQPGQSWRPLGQFPNPMLERGGFESGAVDLAFPIEGRFQKLRVDLRIAPDARRILLGEIIVEGPPPAAPAPAADTPQPVTPMQIKRGLEQALLDAGVMFLYECFPTDVLRDSGGRLAGLVIANRSGRQAISARAIIDATPLAAVARMAGAPVEAAPGAIVQFERIVVGGEPRSDRQQEIRSRASPIQIVDAQGRVHSVHEYLFRWPWKGAADAAVAEYEQQARDLTWTSEVVDGAESLFFVPPEFVHGVRPHRGGWPGASRIDLGAFQARGLPELYILNGCADLDRDSAARLLRPGVLADLGERLGPAAARSAQQRQTLRDVRLPARPVRDPVHGAIREVAAERNPRTQSLGRIPAEERGLPVLAEYDVVVVGGGTGGAPAAIAAGRQGARVLLVEYLHQLGGVGTVGLISSYYHGNRVGFTREVDQGVARLTGPDAKPGTSWVPDVKAEWYRQAVRQAKVDLWFGVLGAGAVVDGDRVRGVVVATPLGRGAILARTVIDSTGNAGVAAAAGAPCTYTGAEDVAVQGTGLPPRALGARYTNTDYTFVDETDVLDIWRVTVQARAKYADAYDLGQLIDTRERRQIVGDAILSPMDMLIGRTHPDTVVIAKSNFDSHGYTVHPLFFLRPPDREDVMVRVPYRCLLPRGLDGILVTGLGISADRDAVPVIRMQADIQNQGYAAGVAAAMIARQGQSTRALDIKSLQKHLVAQGNLPESVLSEADSFPLPAEAIARAVERVGQDYQDLEVLLTQPDTALPLLRRAYATAEFAPARQIYSHILGMLGDATGLDTLIESVQSASWDKGWRYTGMGQFGASVSPLDSRIIALGRTRDPRALDPILDKARQLEPASEFSHFRAIALALESLGDRRAAPVLAALLQKPGVRGHASTSIQNALEKNPPSGTDNTTRNQALTELVLARALYRCGDHEGLGRAILEQYARDLHGHYARHAQAILEERLQRTP